MKNLIGMQEAFNIVSGIAGTHIVVFSVYGLKSKKMRIYFGICSIEKTGLISFEVANHKVYKMLIDRQRIQLDHGWITRDFLRNSHREVIENINYGGPDIESILFLVPTGPYPFERFEAVWSGIQEESVGTGHMVFLKNCLISDYDELLKSKFYETEIISREKRFLAEKEQIKEELFAVTI